jgi:hypothetical protein
MSQAQTNKPSKSGVHIRPRPGQTDLSWREWLLLLFITVVSVVICAAAGRSIVNNLTTAAPTPTLTPTIFRPTVTLIPTPTSAPTFTPTPKVPDTIATGVYVVVTNGVNFRQDASTTAQIIRTLGQGEVLEVIGGPADANNLTWWQLRDPNGVEGWAAQDYIAPTAPPR